MSTAVIPSLWQLQNAQDRSLTELSIAVEELAKGKMKILGEREEDENEEEEIQITE